jgi:hypothetical protein
MRFFETNFFVSAIGSAGGGTQGPVTALLPVTLLKRRTDMRSAFDFAPYRRSTIGFDRLFDLLENRSLG